MYSGVLFCSLFIAGAVLGVDDNQAKLRFYHKSMDNYTELFLDEAEKIFSTSWYNPNHQTVIFCHGFTGYPTGPAVTGVVKAYLSLGSYNVALLNWEKLAALALPGLVNSYLNWALPNAIQLGDVIPYCLLRLEAHGMDLDRTHCVGHSLGAHVWGITGTRLAEKGKKLPWITGLDPAIGFEMKPAHMKLSPASARFVTVLHSDPNKFGTKNHLGTVDFWPNFRKIGNVLQPGCPKNPPAFSDDDFCSHDRSWELLVDAILHPGTILGSYADNFRTWNRYSEAERSENVLELGVYSESALPGNYYFTTAAESPYGLGDEGL